MNTSTQLIRFILITAAGLFFGALVMTAWFTSKQTEDDGFRYNHVDKYKVNAELRKPMMFVNLPTYAAMKVVEHKIDRWQGSSTTSTKDRGWAVFAFILNIIFVIWWVHYNPAKEDTFKDTLDAVLPILAVVQTVGVLFILLSDLPIFVAK
jgi:hypothetical protein